jgi:hypothetical protein
MSEFFPIVTPDGRRLVSQIFQSMSKHIVMIAIERVRWYMSFAPRMQVHFSEVMDGRFWSIYELREAMGKGILTPNLEMELLRFRFI